MKKLMARILNWEASRAKFKAHEIVDCLHLREGDVVADIGSGGGYFTFLFSERVGNSGTVYAVDVDRGNLDYVSDQAARRGLDNVNTVFAVEDTISLPEGEVDNLFARNVFHHLEDPAAYFNGIKGCLKPDGKVVVIDHGEKSKGMFVGLFGHHTPEEDIVDAMGKAGFKVSERFDFLPAQSFMIFEFS